MKEISFAFLQSKRVPGFPKQACSAVSAVLAEHLCFSVPVNKQSQQDAIIVSSPGPDQQYAAGIHHFPELCFVL
jgi:hypothetical protein